MSDNLKDAALHYHRNPTAGKIRIQATKPLSNQRDLALAYSPGVAEPCLEIEKDPLTAADYTSRSNLVGVITNGTAVLGLGNIGALASKPVMEGKAIHSAMLSLSSNQPLAASTWRTLKRHNASKSKLSCANA